MIATTLLHRQVNPNFVQQDRITSQVFEPTSKDSNRLSVYDGDQVSAKDAWVHFTESLKCDSVGVMSVTVGECTTTGLTASPDPNEFPAHAVIMFDGTGNKKKAKQLKNFAQSRGWQHQADLEK